MKMYLETIGLDERGIKNEGSIYSNQALAGLSIICS